MPPILSRQFSIRALLILMSASALGVVVLRAFLTHGGKILAGIVILAIPLMMAAIVLRIAMLAAIQMTTRCYAYFSNNRSH